MVVYNYIINLICIQFIINIQSMNSGEKKLVRIGNYNLTGKVLGKGHFARVEEAIHSILNVKVAIKVINYKEITDTYVQNNLRREAKIMSVVSHPNIIFLFETLESSKNYYLVTELGSGGDLCNYVKSQRFGKLDERQARPLAKQLVSAVGHLHERGIVHRDLKMENILLNSTKEQIKLVDFGLSNFCKYNELLKTHCGSPEYAAPELYISGRKYGPEVDIWSLGIVFYGMLVGKLPFQTWYKADLTQEERRKHLMQETRKGLTYKHQRILMDFSYLFRNLVAKMLNPNANDRITTTELLVHSWLSGNYIKEFPTVDKEWHSKTIGKIANSMKTPFKEVITQMEEKPFGPIGGLYNIEKLSHMNNRLRSNYLRQDIKSFSHTTIGNRPATSRYNRSENLQTSYRRSRPRTTETQNAQSELKATSNFPPKQLCPNKNVAATDAANTTTNTMYFNELKTNHNKSTSAKMFNFFNEKFSQAFGMYTRRGGGGGDRRRIFRDNTDRMDILPEKQRPKSVPTMKKEHLNKRNEFDYFQKSRNFMSTIPQKFVNQQQTQQQQQQYHKQQQQLQKQEQNDISSEISTDRQTARTRFVRNLCAEEKRKQERPFTTPSRFRNNFKQDSSTFYYNNNNNNTNNNNNYNSNKSYKTSNNRNINGNSNYSNPIQNRNRTEMISSTAKGQHQYNIQANQLSEKDVKRNLSVPNHTANRSVVRKELAARNSYPNQGQNGFAVPQRKFS